MRNAASHRDKDGWRRRFVALGRHCWRKLFDGFTYRRMPVDLPPDELFQVHFAALIELAADPGEFVRPRLCHLQREQFHLASIDHHSASSALNLSCEVRHSLSSTSLRWPR